MTAPENAISLTIAGTPDLPGEVLKSLYRITRRSTVELRHAIRDGEPVYVAALFGNDHLDVVPRLEKTADYLTGLGLGFTIHEWLDGAREEISVETMRAIIESADGNDG
ncbi:hypothetical protein [Agromyces aerolatus]|uniref:hypothetical protein n=1 Tax=Agromyces sp. LY-1074 TaxID=3074080 RepID=UPI002861090D|nr:MULTISPECIES: hypothetical protein [unclassified Agromyces]MDR5699217.1 hypothetical protein [Agromyces sp. LY-1074]MDR5705513.1 hypothetical protein [Agromyces sp. LY-1358]